MNEFDAKQIVLAAYGAPGIFAIESLFGMGFMPEQLRLLTHEADARNASLWQFAAAAGVAAKEYRRGDADIVRWVADAEPDLLCSLHFRQKIPKTLLAIPRCGAVNLHPSLLPDYRGCFSLPWAIINGESQTGYTYHYMDENFDTGNILLQRPQEIRPTDTAFSLFHRSIVEGLKSFPEVVRRAILERDPGIAQPSGGRYYKREVPWGGRIDPAWDDQQIDRFIRAMIFPPLPPAQVVVAGQPIPVLSFEQYEQIVGRCASAVHGHPRVAQTV